MSGIRRKDKMNANPLEAQDSKNGKKNVVWRTGRKHEHSAGNGMRELQHDRVKQVSSGANCETRILCLVPVQRIADDWMPEMRGMDAYLVCASGLDDEFDKRERTASSERAPARDGPVSVLLHDGHPPRIPRLATDERLELPVSRTRRSVQHGEIRLLDLSVIFEGPSQRLVRSFRLRGDKRTAGLNVKTVDDSRSLAAPDACN